VLTSKEKGLSPGQRFRLEQWAPHLEADHGIRFDFVPFETTALTKVLYRPGHVPEKALWMLYAFARRALHVARARSYDGVVIYREAALLGPAVYERLMALAKIPIFFDYDDAIWVPQVAASVNGAFAHLKFLGKTDTILGLSTGIFAGNAYLADYARPRNESVFVIPTSIELASYPLVPEPANDDPFVVGWSGSLHTLPHFEHARPALEALARKRRIVVKVICNRGPDRPIAGAENVFVPWSEKGEAAEIGAVHAGIMPLPDDDFTRGKCGLKALQFMATGRPVVISPVGMNRDLVRHGENGFLAGDVDAWVTALDALAASADLRRRLGAEGRATVESTYAAPVVAASVARAIRARLAAAATGRSGPVAPEGARG
jgi:glycosyltransferase involved in cell wall biosynthesis